MKKNILIAALFILSGVEFWQLHESTVRPNNQYEILVYQDHYSIMDGKRQVGLYKWENNPVLDSIVKCDNQ